MNQTVDIIVPVLNEENILEIFYNRIKSLPLKYNLIFIDNASTDKTVEILKRFEGITVIEHEKNEGYGASICDGIKKSDADVIVIIDADCEYPPECIPELLEKLKNSDVVYASRFLNKKKIFNMPKVKIIGNRIITLIFNFLFNQNVTDLYTGCKAIKRSVLEEMNFERKGFEHVLEMGVLLSKKRVVIDEIHVDFSSRHTGRSKMGHIMETLKFLYLVVYYYLRSKHSLAMVKK